MPFCNDTTYKDPGSKVLDSHHQTRKDTVICIWKRDTVSVDTLHSNLLLIVGQKPLHSSSLLSREVWEYEEGDNGRHETSSAFNDEKPLPTCHAPSALQS